MKVRRRPDDPSERLRRIRSLPEDASALPALMLAVEDESLDVARAALRALVPLASARETETLRALMMRVNVGIVGDVARALRALGDEQAADIAGAGLHDESGSVRQKAAIALRELRNAGARTALIAALDDPEAAVRRTATEALAQLPPERDTTSRIAELVRDHDASVRAVAVEAVAQLAPDAPARVADAMHDPHARVRRAAATIETLADDHIAVLLADPAADVRVAMLETLAIAPRPPLFETLLHALADRDWHVRRAACDSLAATGRAEAADPLVAALADPRLAVRGRALVALERLLGADLPDTLEVAIPNAKPEVRRILIGVLGGAGRGLRLTHLAADPDADVRLALVRALLPVRSDPRARETIAALTHDEDAAVRNAALSALEIDDGS